MRLRPSSSSCPQAQQTCGFLVLLLLRLLSSLCCSLCPFISHTTAPLYLHYLIIFTVDNFHCYLLLFIQVHPPFSVMWKCTEENTTASTHVYPEPAGRKAEQRRQSGRSAAGSCKMLGGLKRSESDREKQDRKIISSPTSESNHCQNIFPESFKAEQQKKNQQKKQLVYLHLSASWSASSCFSTLLDLSSAPPQTQPCRIS